MSNAVAGLLLVFRRHEYFVQLGFASDEDSNLP
jgi:hypothetical protein